MPSLRVYAKPASEPLTVAEVMRHLRMDESNQEPAPDAPTVAMASPAAAGNVDNGAHRYLVTFVTADGETQAGTPSAAVTVADKAANGKVVVSDIPRGGSAVTARKLYRTTAGGSTYLLLATIADNTTTTYTDNIADAALGAGAPSTNTTSDPEILRWIAQAREMAENAIGGVLITQTLDYHLDAFPCGAIEVPKGPLQSVMAITYVDENGATQTLDPSAYQVDAEDERGRIAPAYGQTWPATRAQLAAVKVRYVAGFGAAEDVPEQIKGWMKLQIGAFDEVRAYGVAKTEPSPFVDGMINAYRVRRF